MWDFVGNDVFTSYLKIPFHCVYITKFTSISPYVVRGLKLRPDIVCLGIWGKPGGCWISQWSPIACAPQDKLPQPNNLPNYRDQAQCLNIPEEQIPVPWQPEGLFIQDNHIRLQEPDHLTPLLLGNLPASPCLFPLPKNKPRVAMCGPVSYLPLQAESICH